MSRLHVRLCKGILILVLLYGFGSVALGMELVSGSIETGVDDSKQFFVRWVTSGPAMGRVEWGHNTESTEMTAERVALTGDHVHVLVGVLPEGTYVFRLHVYDWSGNGYVTEWNTFVAPSLEPPVLKVRGGVEQAMLTWEPSFGAAAYEVVRRASDGNVTTVRVEAVHYLDDDLSDGTTYEYTVAAIDAVGNVSAPSEPIALAGSSAIIDDAFDGELNTNVWRVYGSNRAAQVRAADGALWVEGLGRNGWDNNDRGVMLRTPIDLTHAVTTVELTYREARWTGQVPGFWGRSDHDGNLYDVPGFFVGLAPQEVLAAIGAETNTIFTPEASGFFIPGIRLQGPVPQAPYTLKWVITHVEGERFQVDVYVDGEHLGTTGMVIGDLDPTELWLYLFVINYQDAGPAAFDRIRISQTFI